MSHEDFTPEEREYVEALTQTLRDKKKMRELDIEINETRDLIRDYLPARIAWLDRCAAVAAGVPHDMDTPAKGPGRLGVLHARLAALLEEQAETKAIQMAADHAYEAAKAKLGSPQ
jgi:hypothetical protein